jgi:hypothetical protein
MSFCISHLFADILNTAQILGIKLFSVSPSEMCDERGASKLSAFNLAKRNSLSAENLIHMAQLHNHWTYGLESPMYTHTATLHLPKPQTAPKTIHLPAPTLQDLLNPAPANEELSFICADPYGTQDLNDDESEAEDSEPIITRGSQVERLKIEKLVDLANAKLLVRYTEPSRLTQPEKSATQPPRAAASPWSDDNWSAKDANF